MPSKRNRADGASPQRWSFNGTMFTIGRFLFIAAGLLAAVIAFDARRPRDDRQRAFELLMVVVFGVGGYVLGRLSSRRP
jgi:hypothetical protein